MVDIKGLDKARVLKALYDHSHVQGSGFLQAVPDGVVTVEHCAGLLAKYSYFDYLHGRVLKVDLSGDEFDERLYDRDCGKGAAQRAVDSIRDETEGGEATTGNTEGKGDGDEWIGFDADMAKAFAESLGVEAEFVLVGSQWTHPRFSARAQ